MASDTTGALPGRTATPAELERRFAGISAETWRRWGREGRLAAYRVSPRRVLLDLDEAEQLVRAARVPRAAGPDCGGAT
jgi:hypothetical protein